MIFCGIRCYFSSFISFFVCFVFWYIFLIEVLLIYSVVPVSAVQQSDSVIHRQTFFFFIFFPADYFLRELPLPPTISSALSVTLPAVLSGDSEASAVGLCSPASHTRVTWAVK